MVSIDTGHTSMELKMFLTGPDINNVKVVRNADPDPEEYDPFTSRKNDHPTSNNDTQNHLLKASLGMGILAMPKAFKCTGFVNGILFTALVAIICTHSAYVLVKCAHLLYVKTRRPQMSFPEVGKAAIENGPQILRGWGAGFSFFIRSSLFVLYFGTCTVYTIIIAENIKQVVEYYSDYKDSDLRLYILALLLPLILMAWVRNLKYLAPVSMVANVCMCLSLTITMYYLVETGDLKTGNIKNMLFKPAQEWPEFFPLIVYAIDTIGFVMPLENAMKNPRAMLGICGVLTRSMTFVTVVYMILGIVGYLRFGDGVLESVTHSLNLNIALIPTQIMKIAFAIAAFCTFGLQFVVCIEIVWNYYQYKFTNKPDVANYVIRTTLVMICVSVAVAIPNIAPFMGVIGAFCFSTLGLIAPAFIEIITYWDIDFGPGKYIIWKNLLLIVFGMFVFVLGTKDAIIKMINIYG